MKMSGIDEIKVSFGALLDEYDFHPMETKVSSSFGDALEVFESEDFRLRFVSDRGQLFVEAGSKTGQNWWFDLNLLRAVILGVPVSPVGIGEQVSFLANNYSAVRDALSLPRIQNTVSKVKEFAERDWAKPTT
jgi:hypothetical protein